MADKNNTVVPRLDEDGFIKDPNLKLNTAMLYFFTSEASQSNTFKGKVKSLKEIVKTNSTNEDGFLQDTKVAITEYLMNLFTDVVVEAEFDIDNEDQAALFTLKLSIEVKDSDNKTYSYANTINIKDDDIWQLEEAIKDLYNT